MASSYSKLLRIRQLRNLVMAEFNKAYVNFVEDEDLYGKYGYFAR